MVVAKAIEPKIKKLPNKISDNTIFKLDKYLTPLPTPETAERTDSAMIIDAMDILYETVVNAYCLVSSDSDYTRLATRIREKGLFVMGIGRRDTPRSFVNACEVFVYTDNISSEKAEVSPPSSDNSAGQAPDPVPLLKAAHELTASDDGWALLGTIGDRLRQLDPGFDPRTYGQKQLSSLVRAHTKDFEVRASKTRGGPIHVRIKQQRRRTARTAKKK